MKWASSWVDAVAPVKSNIRALFRDEVANYQTLTELRANTLANTRLVMVGGVPFLLDAADTTSTDNGFTVVVSADGLRYKRVAEFRERLTTARTYYVRTDGSDNNDGLANTSGRAFLTVQKACNVAAQLDANIYAVTISVGAGTFSEDVTLPSMLGSGTYTLTGAGVASTTIRSVTAAPYAVWSVGGFATSGGNYGLDAKTHARITITGAISFGAASTGHISARNVGASISALSNYTIAGSAPYHWMADEPGSVVAAYARTVTLTGTPNFSGAFAYFAYGGKAIVGAMTFTGGATGTRYSVSSQGGIFTNGGGATYLPGNAAGFLDTASGGVYA
jgi:hypothetical protein